MQDIWRRREKRPPTEAASPFENTRFRWS
jgi:hypothetical protein